MPILTEEQVSILKVAHKQTREKRLADRIKAILYLHYGLSYVEIAKLLLFDEVTIRRYLKQFEDKGIDGLLEYRYTGGKSRLTVLQETELKEFFKEQTPQTAMEVVNHIQKTYTVNYSVIGVTKLLHRLGFVYKKPKVIPAKADREKQEEFITLYKETKKQLGIHDHLYFLDATHPTHNTTLSYGWILKGKENDKYVKTTSGRKRLNLNGALNITDKTAIVLEEKTINTEATIHLLEAIKQKQRHGKVYIILDNASHHHAKLTRRWLLHHPRFKLLFLPAYSPNLNLIERLWRFFHQKVTYNHYFETFGEFKETTLTFFKNLKQYKSELEALLTDNFQLFPSQKLQS
jgi:transposase